MVGKLSNEQKANLTTGLTGSTGCSGTSGGAQSAGFPGLCLQDGPTGVRGTDLVNSYPAELHVGASWNRTLANVVATFMGAEFKEKGGENLIWNLRGRSLAYSFQSMSL